jgi:hypothetical protein
METTKKKKRRIKISANAAILGIYMLILLVCYIYTGNYADALAYSFVVSIFGSLVLSFFLGVFSF